MTFLELAQQVLEEVETPLSSTEIWKFAKKQGYINELDSEGKTPSNTLASQLYTNTKNKVHDKIGWLGSSPVRFHLKGKKYPPDTWELAKIEPEETVSSKKKFSEEDLHPLLNYFIRKELLAYGKTIRHSTSKKASYRQWEHPDVVACYYPEDHWKSPVFDLSQNLGDVQVGIFSFEIKKELSFSNLRQSFFQAVSNSSWAHEGYLVAASISDNPEFLEILKRLNSSFGIGIIKLDIEDPDNSQIILQAEDREHIDWVMVERLSSNRDFEDFIDRINKALNNKEAYEDWYDKLWKKEDLIKQFRN